MSRCQEDHRTAGKKGNGGSYAASAAEARAEIIAMIPKGSKVYRCGSMTAVYMDLWPEIAKIPGVEIIDPFRPGLSFEDSIEPRRQGLLADLMITSTNAITLDGNWSISTDWGTGYRP